MTKIVLDFSPKGGPSDATGTWTASAGDAWLTIAGLEDDAPDAAIEWPDGNKWYLLPKRPGAEPQPPRATPKHDDHVGAFTDPNHLGSGRSWAGFRFFAEVPAHTLNLIGSDDGESWWFLKGKCSGPQMTQISIDFTPKGGPADMGATWKAGGTGPMPGRIYFPDGNSWAHVETAGATVEGSRAPANMPAAGGESTKTVLYAALFALLVLLIAAALQARTHTTPPKI